MNAGQNQEFCVRWNSHLGSIGAAFPQLLAGQRFVDVTLACEGHQVHCHRLVLAACSSYFEAILAENPCKHPVIILPSEIKLWEIQALVDFMYKGEVNVTQAGLPQLLRCAEQLRIRGLHGSDAALNLNQLKALTTKAAAAAAMATVGGSENTETESTNDTCTSRNTPIATASNTVSAAATTAVNPMSAFANNTQQQQVTMAGESQFMKKEINNYANQVKHDRQSNGRSVSFQQQQQRQQQQLSRQRVFKQESHASQSNFSSADDDGDDDDSGAEDSSVPVFAQSEEFAGVTHEGSAMLEDDHSYVAGSSAQDDESFMTNMPDGEADMSAHNMLAGLNSSLDSTGSLKRVRRSEASLAQAAKCVSKGETFQTVSNMFNIPVSTIRFYMARKGILPKRKRGRGASSNSMGGSISAGTLADIKHMQLQQQQHGQPRLDVDEPFQLMAGFPLKSEPQVSII